MTKRKSKRIFAELIIIEHKINDNVSYKKIRVNVLCLIEEVKPIPIPWYKKLTQRGRALTIVLKLFFLGWLVLDKLPGIM